MTDKPTHIWDDSIVTCPKCSARTDFAEINDKQEHKCLNVNCQYEFIVEFEEEEND